MTAWLLKRQGYEVVGITMAIWDGSVPVLDEGRSGCFGPGEARDLEEASAFARRIGMEHRIIPLAEEYQATVLDYFRKEYLAGRTPNPCVRCNKSMKFGFLLERARTMGLDFDLFATGHYARTDYDGSTGRWRLLCARDRLKDQTYFISHLSQDQLARVIFPLGALTKPEVKALAREAGYVELAEKAESQDFIETDDYGVLFKPGDAKAGDIVDTEGRVWGRHRGIMYYTIGQRKGLGIGGAGEPFYVTAVDAEKNRVVVGRREELKKSIFFVDECNWVSRAVAPEIPVRVECKIRQRHPPAPAWLSALGTGARVEFEAPQLSITPGQTAVFYEGDAVAGAGTIQTIE